MRSTQADDLIAAVAAWAMGRDDIRAMAFLGSWARGDPHRASDLDLLLLSDHAADFRRRRQWLAGIDFRDAGFRMRSSEGASYGAVWSLHMWLKPAAEVELTFASCDWANTYPVDAGTQAVVTDAFRIIFDRDGILARLVGVVTAEQGRGEKGCD